MFIQLEVNLGVGTRCTEKRRPRKMTNSGFSLPWILGETREKLEGDMSEPRKVHYKTVLKRSQEAVC